MKRPNLEQMDAKISILRRRLSHLNSRIEQGNDPSLAYHMAEVAALKMALEIIDWYGADRRLDDPSFERESPLWMLERFISIEPFDENALSLLQEKVAFMFERIESGG